MHGNTLDADRPVDSLRGSLPASLPARPIGLAPALAAPYAASPGLLTHTIYKTLASQMTDEAMRRER